MIIPIGLRYVICPGSMPDPKFEAEYKQIYNCWRETWTQAFQELKVDKPFYSDAFTRQDFIGAIFHQNTCIAMAFYRFMDGSREELAADSYFSNWSEKDLEVLLSRGSRIIVCSNFTVHPSARGRDIGISMKDLCIGMITETFLNSDADAMTGAVRVDRGVGVACEKWGAYPISRGVICEYGENNTDLLGFFKDHIKNHPNHELKPVVETLWEKRLVIPRLDVTSQFKKTSPNKKKPKAS